MRIGRKLAIKNSQRLPFSSWKWDRRPDPRDPRRPGGGRRSAGPGPGLVSGWAGRRSDRRFRDLRLRPGVGANRSVLPVLLRRLRRTGQEPGVRQPRRRSGRVRPLRPAPRPFCVVAAVRPDPAFRLRRSVVVVARRRFRPPRTVAIRGRPDFGSRRACRADRRKRATGRDPPKKSEAGLSLPAAVASVTITAPDERVRLLKLAADDLRQAGTISDLFLVPGGPDAEESVVIELADSPA